MVHAFDSNLPTPVLSTRPEPTTHAPAKPFLKWVGGKTQLLDQLLRLAPPSFNGYHEPFLGGGAMFFALAREGRLEGKDVQLCDVNHELVDTYLAIRDRVRSVVLHLSAHRHERAYYYEVRSQDPSKLSPSARAARMLYLNRCGFNGLYRVNRKGEFNVPFGRYTNPRICDEQNLLAASRALSRARVSHRDFEHVLEQTRPGDFVYFDPPYVPLSASSSFTSYAKGGFGEPEQERLARLFEQLSANGVFCMLSNSDAEWVRERYSDFRVLPVLARRNVNSNPDRRGPITEVVVLGYDPAKKSLRPARIPEERISNRPHVPPTAPKDRFTASQRPRRLDD
ncbi:MAG: DNA adenine methylase [Deltaproteobacteria bacterium]|nr:DNA adenine methylase [Deltaproteobacteria bacterium]